MGAPSAPLGIADSCVFGDYPADCVSPLRPMQVCRHQVYVLIPKRDRLAALG